MELYVLYMNSAMRARAGKQVEGYRGKYSENNV